MSLKKPPLHVVLGAGQVGPLVATELVARGHEVRLVSRTAPRYAGGATWVRGDLTDRAFTREVTRGAHVVYHTANPMRYDQWETLLPPLSRSVLQGLAGSRTHLVLLDNLYMYGAPDGGVIRDDAPLRPQSRKGELRATLADEFLRAQARGDLSLSIGRAPDFFGPDSARSAVFHPLFFAKLARGSASPVLGDPDLPHAHAYIPDVARALVLLGAARSSSARPWLLPVAWNGSVRELFDVFARLSGRAVRPWRVPGWLWPVAGLFNGELGAVREMLHQWNAPLIVDDSRFTKELGMRATPIEAAVRDTLRAHGVPLPDVATVRAA